MRQQQVGAEDPSSGRKSHQRVLLPSFSMPGQLLGRGAFYLETLKGRQERRFSYYSRGSRKGLLWLLLAAIRGCCLPACLPGMHILLSFLHLPSAVCSSGRGWDSSLCYTLCCFSALVAGNTPAAAAIPELCTSYLIRISIQGQMLWHCIPGIPKETHP